MRAHSHIPHATYRLQLNHDFTFTRATAIVPYLAALGMMSPGVSRARRPKTGNNKGMLILNEEDKDEH